MDVPTNQVTPPTPTSTPAAAPMTANPQMQAKGPNMVILLVIMLILLGAVGAGAYYMGLIQGRSEVVLPAEVQESSPFPTETISPTLSPTEALSPTPTEDLMISPTATPITY